MILIGEEDLAMSTEQVDQQSAGIKDRCRGLLAVSEAIVLHRDLPALFRELSARLHEVVRFDWLGLVLHDAAAQKMRVHVLEPPDPGMVPGFDTPLEETAAGVVWR